MQAVQPYTMYAGSAIRMLEISETSAVYWLLIISKCVEKIGMKWVKQCIFIPNCDADSATKEQNQERNNLFTLSNKVGSIKNAFL